MVERLFLRNSDLRKNKIRTSFIHKTLWALSVQYFYIWLVLATLGWNPALDKIHTMMLASMILSYHA